MPYITPNKDQQKYVLGIDFGHGETSADLCMIQWDDVYMQLEDPETIEIFNGVTAIPSLLLVEHTPSDEKAYIGNPAVLKYTDLKSHESPNNSFSFYSYFKKVPSAMSSDDKLVMGLFMREVYKQIRRQRQELTDTNHVVYIACPSNPDIWAEDELTAYAQIASDAGLPLVKISDRRTGLIRESRAAFIKACSSPNTKASVKEGILLIDFGSSTVDLTYYSSKCEKPIDDGGAYCGASQVEKTLFEALKETDERVGKTIEKTPSAETTMLYYIRRAKEEFYSNSYGADNMELSISLTKATGGKLRGYLDESYPNEEVKSLLSGYIQDINKCFTDYRDKHLKGKPIKLVFLTGGASRMDFIQDIVRSVYNYKGDIYREMNPSLTISNGIALTGRADLRTYAMEQQLLNSREIVVADIATPTLKQAATEIASEVLKKVGDCYKSFANQGFDDTIACLEQTIKKKINSISNSTFLNEAFKIELKDITNKRIIPHINEIVKDYFPDFAIPAIRSGSTFQAVVEYDNIATLSSMISDSVEKISEGFLEGLGKVIFNIISGGIVVVEGLLENGVKYAWKKFTGSYVEYANIAKRIDDSVLSFRDKQTRLSSERRKQVRDMFEEKKNSYQTGVYNSIEGILFKDEKLKNQINTVGRKEIKKYICEQVDKARLNLN